MAKRKLDVGPTHPYVIRGVVEMRVAFRDRASRTRDSREGAPFSLAPGAVVETSDTAALAAMDGMRDDAGAAMFTVAASRTDLDYDAHIDRYRDGPIDWGRSG